jgi:P-type Ca2+ transporter type 2C
MVTGDNIETAKAIALECGILDANSVISEPVVIEGKVFREMSESARGEAADKIIVTLSHYVSQVVWCFLSLCQCSHSSLHPLEYFLSPFILFGSVELINLFQVMGRSSPNDKLLLVQALKRKGHVVAVTGDGTNDAPALHEVTCSAQGIDEALHIAPFLCIDELTVSNCCLASSFVVLGRYRSFNGHFRDRSC